VFNGTPLLYQDLPENCVLTEVRDFFATTNQRHC